MVRFTTPVTGILAAEMADASAGWSPTVKRNALVHPPPSQHPLISLPSTLAPLANGPTAIGPRPLRSFEPLQSVTALSRGWDNSKHNAQVLIYDRDPWTLHITKCLPSCMAQRLPALLLLDSFMPSLREAMLQQACKHTQEVWNLDIAPRQTLTLCSSGLAAYQRETYQIGCSDTPEELSSPLSLVLVRREMG